jgi:hypothetical protein
MEHEIVIDPDIGRLLLGVSAEAERDALAETVDSELVARIFVGETYGAVGAVGAHPDSRAASPSTFDGEATELRAVTAMGGGTSLQAAFDDLHTAAHPVVIEIQDSLVHTLDLSSVTGVDASDGPEALSLRHSLIVRAASGQRPIVRLTQPLRFRPVDPADPSVSGLVVRLEGIFVTRHEDFPAGEALIARAAVARLELLHCTLDPEGHRLRDGLRAAVAPSAVSLGADYGFADALDEEAFEPTPDVLLQHSISGALRIDEGYRVCAEASLVDAGEGPGAADGAFAFGAVDSPADHWGAPLEVRGVTFFGRVRSSEARGSGGIFVRRLEVWNNQRGCLKHCYFRGDADRLPPNHACVLGTRAQLAFTSHWFADPGYGQLAARADRRIRTRGPGDDAMGAFGFLREAHKWSNFNIRLREFMPLGIRPLRITVT